jgi:HK97 family phage major capsid protein
MSDTNVKEVEIDEQTAEAIAKHVKAPEIDYDKIAEKIAEKSKPADKEVNKLADDGDNDGEQDGQPVEGEVVDKYAKMSKEAFVVAQINAAMQKDSSTLAKLNAHAMKTLQDKQLVNKDTYMNAGTAADGAVLIPSAELMTDVLNLLSDYSPLAGLARVVTLSSGNTINIDALTADVTMTEVGSEGGSKTVTKPTLAQSSVTLREFAGIAILTKKLINQAAFDVYSIVRDSFARAIAKKREQLLITDATTGLVNVSGTVAYNMATGNTLVDTITVKKLKAMPFQVSTASASRGIYVFSRLLAGSLATREDSTGQPIVTTNSQNGGTLTGTFNGYPYVVAETLGTTDAASTVHALFGNFQDYAVVVRQGQIDTSVFDSGVVVDGGSVSHNLIQENKVAVRAEVWENVGYPLPGAFVKLATSAT